VLMLPWPSFKVPFQIAEAVRCMGLSCGLPDSDAVRRNSSGRVCLRPGYQELFYSCEAPKSSFGAAPPNVAPG
jgi:hypothetical protein